MANKELLKVTNDYVFRKIFGEVGNEDITGDLIEKILSKKYKKIDLSKNPILLPETIENKSGVLDVIVKAEEKDNINIEMQVLEYEYMAERILEYWAKKYSDEFKKGDDYSVAQRTICILITCFEMKQLKDIEKFHTKWNIREEIYTQVILTDKLEFHIINLKKLEKKINNEEKELINWCKFISSPDTLEGKIMKENKSIERAKEVLEKISQDEQERDMAYRRERAIRDQKASIASGYNKGKEEGRTEKQKEIVLKMLDKNISINDIIEITGITQEEIEQINKA